VVRAPVAKAMSARNAVRSLWILLIAGCGREVAPAPPPECVAAWSQPAATELVDLLVQATGADRTVWTDYDARDASYVLNAGPSDSGGVCPGLWQNGGAVSFVRSSSCFRTAWWTS
jgi:hypothetical protein